MTSRTPLDASIVPKRTQGEGHPDKAQGPELFVLDSVDGFSSIEELAMMLAMGENDVMAIVARLHELQLVHWDDVIEDGTEEGVAPSMERSYEPPGESLVREASAFEGGEMEDGTAETFRFVTAPAVTGDVQDSKRQQQTTVEHRSVESKIERPSAPPPLPRGGASTPPRRDVIKTPRQHLDTSWWRSAGRTHEPDEKLTSREISNSGLRFAPPTPENPAPPEHGLGEKATAQHEVITDRVEPISGSMETQQDASDVQSTDTVPHVRKSAVDERTTSQSPESIVDEVAHTRGGGAPLLPDIEFDDDWGHDDITSPIDTKVPWADEPVPESLERVRGQWTNDEIQQVAYYARLIEHGTYYDIFDVRSDAAVDEIRAAADDIAARMDFARLRGRGTPEGRATLQKVQNGLQRAFDVLEKADARAQYDAALAALAAFKLS